MIEPRLLSEGEIVVSFPQEPVAWAEAIIPTLEQRTCIKLLQMWWNFPCTQAVLPQLPDELRERFIDAYNRALIRLRRQGA